MLPIAFSLRVLEDGLGLEKEVVLKGPTQTEQDPLTTGTHE